MAEVDMDLLLSVVKGLGSFVTDQKGSKAYCRDNDCLPCLKDLQRLLRQDESNTREAFQVLGQYNIAKSDLVPIIVMYPKETDIVYNSLKVLTHLSMPIDPASENKLMQADYMQLVKEAFMEKDAMAVIVGLVAEPLGRHPRMSEADGLIVQLVITFIRNLLVIPDRAATAGSGGDHRTRLRQELLTRMFDDNVMELLLVIAQHAHARPFKSEAPLLMEIFQQVFKGATATDLAKAAAPTAPQQQPGQSRRAVVRPKGSGMAHERAAMERQMAKLRQSSAAPARHARFGGLFVKRYNSESRGSVMRSNPLVPDLPAIPELKKTSKTQAEGRPPAQLQAQLLWKLRQYLDQLLQAGSLNVVMQAVMQDLKAGLHISRLSRDDFVCFFCLAQLTAAYVRIQEEETLRRKQEAQKRQQQKPSTHDADTADSSHAAAASAETAALLPADKSRAAAEPALSNSIDKGKPSIEDARKADSPFACVSAILGWETFHMVHVLWIGLVDLPGKAPEKDWEMQHESLGMLKEMLFALDLALHVGTPADRKAADRLQRRLLHDDMKESGLLPVTGRLLKSFNFAYQPRSHAVDLVQALHVILRMLDRLNTSEAGGFLVKQKGRAGGGRKKKPQPPSREGTPEQVKGSPAGAAAAAPGAEGTQASPSPSPDVEGGRTGNPFEEEEREAAEEARRRQVREVAYDLQRRVKQELAFPAVIHFYCWLLQGFATNGAFLNHCLVAYLRRIADPAGLNLEPMLYQLSVLRVFQAILSDKAFRKQGGSGEVIHLATHVTRNLFTRLAPDNPYEDDDVLLDELDLDEEEGEDEEAERKREARARLRMEAEVRQKASAMMFIELMFWKNASVAESVRDEYNWRDMYDKQRGKKRGFGSDADSDGGQIGFGSSRSKKGIMSDEQATELQDMFEEVNGMKDCLQRCVTGMAGVFKKSQISRQLKAMGLKRNILTRSQEERLQGLYKKHHEDRTYLAILADKMPGGFSKGQISSQLRKLGLRKSKGKKARGMTEAGSQASSSASGSDADSHSDSDSDSSAASQPAAAEQDLQAMQGGGDEQVQGQAAVSGLSGSKAAAKRKSSSASKRTKKQKRADTKAGHTNINDWSSDDSSSAEHATKQDEPHATSDSDEVNADAAALGRRHEAASAGKQKKQQAEQQSAGRKSKKKSSGGTRRHGKRKSSGGAKNRAHAKHARAGDWTSDDSSDAQPERIIDNLEPMSDSDADNHEGNRLDTGSAKAQGMLASPLGKQCKKQFSEEKSLAQPDSSSSPAKHVSRRASDAEEEEDWGQQAAMSDDEVQPAKQAKRKGRLRKARASPGRPAAAGREVDDVMVDLEDDIPEVEMEVEHHGREAAEKLSETDLLQDNLVAEDAGQKTKRSGRSVRVGGQDSAKEAARHAGKLQDKQRSRHEDNDKAPRETAKSKRLKKQVDIPHAARSALDALRAERLQKHSTAAPSPMLASPPLHDTLPPSEPPCDPSQPQGGAAPSPTRDLQPSGHDMPPVSNTLPNSIPEGPSNAASEAQHDVPSSSDMEMGAEAIHMQAAEQATEQATEQAAQIGNATSGKTPAAAVAAPMHDTLDPSMTLGQDSIEQEEEVGDDVMLIRQAVSDEAAGAGRTSPSPGQDDDDDEALLQSLLEEETTQLTTC